MPVMAHPDFKLEFIKDQNRLIRLSDGLRQASAIAVDLETSEWWNRQRERVALVQIAFRSNGQVKVGLIDALADLDLEVLRPAFENPRILKIMHNAAFDATRLAKYYNLAAAPIHDTMIAARRAGERKYSLQAQALIHLQIRLDKQSQNSDWSRRPLDARQLSYAALDAYATLLLYENQTARNIGGNYKLKYSMDKSAQFLLPLDRSPQMQPTESIASAVESTTTLRGTAEEEITPVGAALLGIVVQLPDRYSPMQLSVSLGSDRIGLAGWIVDSRLGKDAELDEETVKMTIADLCERRLLQITPTRKLKATEAGNLIWEKFQ